MIIINLGLFAACSGMCAYGVALYRGTRDGKYAFLAGLNAMCAFINLALAINAVI